MRVLIAGFSSFPGAPHNPSEDLVLSLSSSSAQPDWATVVLPVAWEESWPRLKQAIAECRAEVVLLFGLHGRTERMRIELQAHNHRELGRIDAAGEFPSGPSVLDGPQTIPARLDWPSVARTLRAAGIEFEWSTDAGGYLCNDTLYHLAYEADALGVHHFGFFHVPLSDERVGDVVALGKVPEVFCSLPAARLQEAAIALAGLYGGPSL